MTKELFREDSYKKQIFATVVEIQPQGIVLDQTIFYPLGGGQPGDKGIVRGGDGLEWQVTDTRKDRETGTIFHITDPANTIEVGDEVLLSIDWGWRYAHMRMHTCLHLLCSLIDASVTGGCMNGCKGRLDFALDAAPDKEQLAEDLNKLIQANTPVSLQWITDNELDAQPELVRTLSVKPPRGTGLVRLINIKSVDIQPCGGTHVQNTGEIGPVRITKIENKGKQNRRINVELESTG
jgi:misacylated tRNA(Ala) deacylase